MSHERCVRQARLDGPADDSVALRGAVDDDPSWHGGPGPRAGGSDLEVLSCKQPVSTPADAWRQVEFDDTRWEWDRRLRLCDNDDATVLNDMLGRYATVYIRKGFPLPL